jgi:hypothetical protein
MAAPSDNLSKTDSIIPRVGQGESRMVKKLIFASEEAGVSPTEGSCRFPTQIIPEPPSKVDRRTRIVHALEVSESSCARKL